MYHTGKVPLQRITWNAKFYCHLISSLTIASFIYDVVQSAAAGYRRVGQNSSSVQMADANHVGAAIFVLVARRGRLDDDID